ncbi:MAG TPA: DUF6496 domain-containing protein [Thermoanaerobaculia bacterium]|nr:DUF6496 domain-containing protein [Thermoanaerobaculia bacterium]
MAREREYPDTDAEARDLAERDRREGKSASTQAGEFVREEMHHVREGKHGARSSKQAIAIGLSKARRAGVDLAPPKKGTAPEETIEAAERETAAAPRRRRPNAKRSRATKKALRREGRKAASKSALARQARSAARRRGARARSQAAKKAARTRTRRR